MQDRINAVDKNIFRSLKKTYFSVVKEKRRARTKVKVNDPNLNTKRANALSAAKGLLGSVSPITTKAAGI
jgi:hypothetical protein